MRFHKIVTARELKNFFIVIEPEANYTELTNDTGGDEDFMVVDTLNKEFIWWENGFYPFCSDEEIARINADENQDQYDLKTLQQDRY